MSEEQFKAFLELVKADAGVQEQLKAAGDADAVVAIAKDAGFMIIAEELKNAQAEVSDEELEGAAGGQQLRGCEPCSTWGWRHTSTESAREPCRM